MRTSYIIKPDSHAYGMNLLHPSLQSIYILMEDPMPTYLPRKVISPYFMQPTRKLNKLQVQKLQPMAWALFSFKFPTRIFRLFHAGLHIICQAIHNAHSVKELSRNTTNINLSELKHSTGSISLTTKTILSNFPLYLYTKTPN